MFSHQRSGFRRVAISGVTAKRETCARPSGEAGLLPAHRAFIARPPMTGSGRLGPPIRPAWHFCPTSFGGGRPGRAYNAGVVAAVGDATIG